MMTTEGKRGRIAESKRSSKKEEKKTVPNSLNEQKLIWTPLRMFPEPLCPCGQAIYSLDTQCPPCPDLFSLDTASTHDFKPHAHLLVCAHKPACEQL